MLTRQGLMRLRIVYLVLFCFSIVLLGMSLVVHDAPRKIVFGSGMSVFLFSGYFWVLAMVYKLAPNYVRHKEKEFLDKK